MENRIKKIHENSLKEHYKLSGVLTECDFLSVWRVMHRFDWSLTSVSLSLELLRMEGLDSPLMLSLSLSLQLFWPGFNWKSQRQQKETIRYSKKRKGTKLSYVSK